MKNIFILIETIVLFSSCANSGNSNLQSRTVEDYYVTTGVEKYFLTDKGRLLADRIAMELFFE